MLIAVMFDFDGILVDTEPLHYQAYQHVLNPEGMAYSWEEYTTHYIGFDDRDGFREAYKRMGRGIDSNRLQDLVIRKAEIFAGLAAKSAICLYPGVERLLRELQGQATVGLCSGALASDIRPIVEDTGISDCFAFMVTADEVATSKPDPESYRSALWKLSELRGCSIDPAACIAIEDTPAGIQSAGGAGLVSVAVTNTHSAEHLKGADGVVDSLDRMTLDRLRRLVERRGCKTK